MCARNIRSSVGRWRGWGVAWCVLLFSSCLSALASVPHPYGWEDDRQIDQILPKPCEEYRLEPLPLFYWQENQAVNFGDYLSLLIVERIVGEPVRYYRKGKQWKERKLLALGSILSFAGEGDVVWGSGINGKLLSKEAYHFRHLDIRAVRGPLTRQFLMDHFSLECPEIYGDPALLFPRLFPEFQRAASPSQEYVVIVHYLDFLPKDREGRIVYATDPWDEVVRKILDSKFVISSTLHGVILAEAYGIPARLLRLSEKEPLFKFQDYYLGTGRATFQFAFSIPEALALGGEPSPQYDLDQLYHAFPFEFWNTP
jgi:pyruvyltransferase